MNASHPYIYKPVTRLQLQVLYDGNSPSSVMFSLLMVRQTVLSLSYALIWSPPTPGSIAFIGKMMMSQEEMDVYHAGDRFHLTPVAVSLS